ncbi:RDD family protein [Nocardiopsis sp. N85]|uniref:RDD family protein n=1 Tax=Nocardiopsis sp. N85 TaxID=3029400 RepID=UPI00237F1F9A|nr:RDD family protein [Nocardiopsis sp. N85]MDE3721747.1 RDD family protein [Nocardiopsis sp. N85]
MGPPPVPVGAWGPTPPARPVPSGPERASFGRRLSARLIDYVLVVFAATAFFVFMALVILLITGDDESSDAQGEVWAWLFLFGWGVLLFFYDWLYLVTWGRTLGKMMLGIKVVRMDGGRLTQGQAMGRAAVFGLPQCLPCVGHVFSGIESMAALGEDRRALHDRMSGTLVVRT